MLFQFSLFHPPIVPISHCFTFLAFQCCTTSIFSCLQFYQYPRSCVYYSHCFKLFHTVPEFYTVSVFYCSITSILHSSSGHGCLAIKTTRWKGVLYYKLLVSLSYCFTFLSFARSPVSQSYCSTVFSSLPLSRTYLFNRSIASLPHCLRSPYLNVSQFHSVLLTRI